MRIRLPLVSLAAALVAMLPSLTAHATPRPLPFTYTTETLSKDTFEVEQYADVTPLRARSTSTGLPVWYLGSQFQTELEYGITDRLELGLYFVIVPSPGEAYALTAPMTEGTGVKQRLRYIFADPGAWPIDVGVYGELVENDHEVEIEAKVLLQRRLGKLRIATNLWAEYEVYYQHQRDFVLNPTLGATYEISRLFHLGLEGWMRVEFPSPAPNPRPYSVGPIGYIGPTFLLNFGKFWWSTGIYARIAHPAFDAGLTIPANGQQPGQPYGPVWARTMIGFEL